MEKGRGGSVLDRVVVVVCSIALIIGLYFILVSLGVFTGYTFHLTCSDSDGGSNYARLGSVTSNAGTSSDSCTSATVLNELSCDSNNQQQSNSYTCPEGCNAGKCTNMADPFGNVDSYIKKAGSAADYISDATLTITKSGVTHTAVRDGIKYSFSNVPTGVYDATMTAPGYSSNTVPGQITVTGGETFTIHFQMTPLSPDSCNDPDGGKIYTVRSKVVIGSSGFGEDNCVSESVLTEYFCSSATQGSSETYTCPAGQKCVTGACVASTTPAPTSQDPLVRKWSFEEASFGTEAGAIKDDYKFSNATALGGITNQPGKIGKAAVFDGIDDALRVPALTLTSFSPRSGFAISGWFKTNNLTGGDITASWVSKRNAYVFGPNKDGSVDFWVYLGGSWSAPVHSAAGSIKAGTWQYWTAVYNGTHLILYLDGVAVASQAVTGALPSSSTGDLYIGHDYLEGQSIKRYFNGSIDELRIYEDALTANNVSALYQAQLAASGSPAPDSPNVISLDGCAAITQPGSYILSKSFITANNCITIDADNVSFDGQSNTINLAEISDNPILGGPPSTVYGLQVKNRVNVSVKNLRLEGFTVGILLHKTKNVKLENVRVTQTLVVGMHLNDTIGAYVLDSLVERGFGSGVIFEGSSYNIMNRVSIRYHEIHGVYFAKSSISNSLYKITFGDNAYGDNASDATSRTNFITFSSSTEKDNNPATPFIVQATQLSKGYNKTMYTGETLLFKVGTKTHNITVASYAGGILTVVIRSEPVTVVLSSGETKQVDLNGNGKNDLNVTFNSVVNGKPMITLKSISEGTTSPPSTGTLPGGGGTTPPGTIINVTNSTKLDGKNESGWDTQTMIIVIVALIIFIILVIVAIIFAMKHQRTGNEEFYRPQPSSSTLQPGSNYNPGASM